MTKDEALKECTTRMEYAASKIRAAALSAGFGYSYAVNAPVGPHGGWAQEHLYWLHCMDVVRHSDASTSFEIINYFLNVNTGTGYMPVYMRD